MERLRVNSIVPALASTLVELIPTAAPDDVLNEKRAFLGMVLASSELKDSVRRLPLTVALVSLAA